jgi:hypothetical protein
MTESASNPRRTLSAFLVMSACSSVFLDYWEYSKGFHGNPDIWDATLRGQSDAPLQYRIGVLKAAQFLTHAHLGMRHALALIDFIAVLIAMFVLRSLLTRSTTWRAVGVTAKWFGAAAFVVLIQYSLCWLIWYQRPETLPTAALLALSLWLCTYRLAAGAALTGFCLVMLGFLLGFVRADAAVAFNAGIALICLTPLGKKFALPRWGQFAASLAAAAAAAATQLYIMRIVYPHATYGATPIFQLVLNIAEPLRIVPFVLFMIPTVWIAVQVLRCRFSPGPAQSGLLLGAALFIALWAVLGKIDEVRIFLPFALALAPLTVEVAMARIAAAENIPNPHNVF